MAKENLEKELAAAREELAAAKKLLQEASDAHDALSKEFEEFKLQAIEEIKAAKANSVTVISDKVVEHGGKKYEFTINTFSVIGVKGKFHAKDIVKAPEQHAALIEKLVEMNSSVLKELVADATETK